MNKPEKITADKMQKLFGANYSGISYYDFRTGHAVYAPAFSDTASSKYLPVLGNRGQKYIEYIAQRHAEPQVLSISKSDDKQMSALAVMNIASENYPGRYQGVLSPSFHRNGRGVVCNAIYCSTRTGEILPVSDKWYGVVDFGDMRIASDVVMHRGLCDLLAQTQRYHVLISANYANKVH